MTLLPDNLTDDELVLLQLAGELPDEADPVVADRLAANPQAGRDLRDAWAMLDGRLRADGAAVSRLATSAAASARSIVAAVQLMEADTVPAEPVARRLRLPPTWTLYPLGAAAAVVLAMVGWWYNVHDEFAVKAANNKPYDPNPAVLILPGAPDADPASQSDDEIAAQFNSMIPDGRVPGGGFNGGFGNGGFGPGSFEREYAALEMLENPIQ